MQKLDVELEAKAGMAVLRAGAPRAEGGNTGGNTTLPKPTQTDPSEEPETA